MPLPKRRKLGVGICAEIPDGWATNQGSCLFQTGVHGSHLCCLFFEVEFYSWNSFGAAYFWQSVVVAMYFDPKPGCWQLKSHSKRVARHGPKVNKWVEDLTGHTPEKVTFIPKIAIRLYVFERKCICLTIIFGSRKRSRIPPLKVPGGAQLCLASGTSRSSYRWVNGKNNKSSWMPGIHRKPGLENDWILKSDLEQKSEFLK